MYKRDAETVDHLLIYCSVAWELWTLMFSWLECHGALNCVDARVGKRRKSVWAMITLCLMWIIWCERNLRCFEGVANPLFRIKSFFD